jgi:hypothetical protein
MNLYFDKILERNNYIDITLRKILMFITTKLANNLLEPYFFVSKLSDLLPYEKSLYLVISYIPKELDDSIIQSRLISIIEVPLLGAMILRLETKKLEN